MTLDQVGGERRPAPAGGAVISVVTVTYNDVESLRRTLDSVVAQRWAGIEQIVVDGGSTDGTAALLAKRDREIAAWRSEPDKGIYDAMNKGLSLASGEYVLFLNSGDTLRGRVLFDGQDWTRLLPVVAVSFWGRPRFLKLRDLRLGMPYCHQGIIFRNSGLVAFDTSYRIAADYEFLLANLAQAGLQPPPREPAGWVVFDASGISSTQVLRRDVEAAAIVRRRYGSLRWALFWARQAPKLAMRWLLARWRGPATGAASA
jgi:glycosyltransferase involved in cell wall biosynthesis